MRRKILWLLWRLALATALALVIMALPQAGELPAWLDAAWTPAIIFVLLCYTGALLYDTFFYDHYRP